MPEASILIPVYNRERYIGQCLDSCIMQTHRDIEIICYNDGSTDNTTAVIDSYINRDKRIRLVNSKENCGIPNAFNNLLAACNTKYACWLGSDDMSSIYRIEMQLEFIRQQGHPIIFCYGGIYTDIIPIELINAKPVNHGCLPYGSAFFEVSKVPKFKELPSFNGSNKPTTLGGADAIWMMDILQKYWPDVKVKNVCEISPLMPYLSKRLYFVRRHKDRVWTWRGNPKLNPGWYNRMLARGKNARG